jgi:parvulin-like peptidyl-prolyl isomerase
MGKPRLGAALALVAGAIMIGCVSERAELRGMLQDSLAEALAAPESPRVARMAQAGPQAGAQAGYIPAAPPPLDNTQPVRFRPNDPRGEGPDTAREVLRVNVRARVNGKPIFDEDIFNAILPDLQRIRRSYTEPQRSEKELELFNTALEKFIEEELIHQDAMSKLKKNNPRALDKIREFARKEFDKKFRAVLEQRKWTESELLDQLKREGLTVETWQRKEERDFLIRAYLQNRIYPEIQKRVNHSEMREFYETHLNEFQQVDKVKWQNIFVAVGPKNPTLDDARRTAEWLIDRWREGEDFAALLEFHDGPTRNGEGYGSRRGEIKPPELEDHVFLLREGEIGPAVDFPTGVHIFKVTKRDYAGQIPFNEEVQKTIRRRLTNEIAVREEKRVIQELKGRAVIEINP